MPPKEEKSKVKAEASSKKEAKEPTSKKTVTKPIAKEAKKEAKPKAEEKNQVKLKEQKSEKKPERVKDKVPEVKKEAEGGESKNEKDEDLLKKVENTTAIKREDITEFVSTVEEPLPFGLQRPVPLERAVGSAPARPRVGEDEDDERFSYGKKSAAYKTDAVEAAPQVKYDISRELRDVLRVEREGLKFEGANIAPYFKKALQTEVYDSMENRDRKYEGRMDEARLERESKLYEIGKAKDKEKKKDLFI